MASAKRVTRSELTVSCESNARSKNFISILLSIVVLTLISSMIVAAIVIINPEITNGFSGRHFAPRVAITLEEALTGELLPNDHEFQWLSSKTPIVNPVASPLESTEPQEDQDELLFEDSKNINVIPMPPSGKSNKSSLSSPAASSEQQDERHSSLLYAKSHPPKALPATFKPTVKTLVSNSSLLASIEYDGFKISPTKRYLLLWTNKRRQFRHSFTARYFVYDIKLDLISRLSTQSSQPSDVQFSSSANTYNSYENLDSANSYLNTLSDNDNEFTRFQLVDWYKAEASPVRDSLILIQRNDIYLLNDVSGEGYLTDDNSNSNTSSRAASRAQRQIAPQRVTYTGKINEIFNGVPDWLYEEEILGDAPAFQVSPKATSLAYMSFNDSLVALMPFTLYGNSEQILPRVQQFRYPKAGRVNPRVTIHVLEDLSRSPDQLKDVALLLPDELAKRQHYINRIRWLTDDKLALIWLNRNQNESHVIICSRQDDWQCKKNLYMSSPGGWLDLSDDMLMPLNDEHYLAMMLKHEGDDVGSFKHIARVSLNQKDSYTFLTGGRKEVLGINGVNKEKSLVFYTSTVENESGQRQLFYAHLNGASVDPKPSVCITCDLYPDECLFNFAKMSPSTNYYIFECSGPGIPRIELRSTFAMETMEAPASAPSPLATDHLVATTTHDQSEGSSIRPTTRAPASNLLSNLIDLPLAGKSAPEFAANTADESVASFAKHKRSILPANGELPVESPTQDSTLLWTIEDNRELKEKLLNNKVMPLTMRLKVPIPNTNYSASVLMLLPPQLGPMTTFRAATTPSAAPTGGHSTSGRLRRSAIPRNLNGVEQPLHAHFTADSIKDYTNQLPSGERYPMVVDVYAGPGSMKVDYRFNIYFGHYLASSRRTIYAMIDGRGSGNQGTKRLFELRHAFGTKEIQDQIEVTHYLTRNFSFIDPNKVAIWGWSYGGYAAAMALAQSNAKALQLLQTYMEEPSLLNATATRDTLLTGRAAVSSHGVFECAASVAPVTNWIYYDTAYTERYMSSPYHNELYDEEVSGDHVSRGKVGAKDLEDGHERKPYSEGSQQQQIASSTATSNRWIPLNQTSRYFLAQNGRFGANTNQSRSQSISHLNDRYKRASLIEHIADIDHRRFLLIHGTADDNVHFQQSIMLMKQLIHKNVQYETRLYPDQDHAIANKADKLHLGATLSNFFAECFDMDY